MTRSLSILIFALAASACSTAKQQQRNPSLWETNAAKCRAAGGTPDHIGKRGLPACLTVYLDGGHACTDDGQCLGGCEPDPDADRQPGKADDVATGVCRRDNNPYGCHSDIANGQLKPGPCRD
jgi:hypothetical protein